MAIQCSTSDPLSLSTQNALNRLLRPGEKVILALAGSPDEALVVTENRIVILREHRQVVGSAADVDCYEHAFAAIKDVRVALTTAGGTFTLDLNNPPRSDLETAIHFASYHLAKFEACATYLRTVLKTGDSGENVNAGNQPFSAESPTEHATACVRCGAAIGTHHLFCAACGAPQGKACGWCNWPLPPTAIFCPYCGASAKNVRELTCAGCGNAVAPNFIYCPKCGKNQGRNCPHCGAGMLPVWLYCVQCGASPDTLPTQPAPARQPSTAVGQHKTAEEHNELGMSLYEQEKYEEAVNEFETALDLAPGTPLYHANLGVVLAEMGRDEEALEEYQVAVRLAPNDPTAYLNLGYFYSEREQPQEAVKAWRKVVEVAPHSTEAEEAENNLENQDEI